MPHSGYSSYTPSPRLSSRLREKIGFDIDQLDNEGLYGPPDDRRSLSYEFCMPANSSMVAAVTTIDFSVSIYENTPGRIGCDSRELLLIGNSHQDNFKSVIGQLAQLSLSSGSNVVTVSEFSARR